MQKPSAINTAASRAGALEGFSTPRGLPSRAQRQETSSQLLKRFSSQTIVPTNESGTQKRISFGLAGLRAKLTNRGNPRPSPGPSPSLSPKPELVGFPLLDPPGVVLVPTNSDSELERQVLNELEAQTTLDQTRLAARESSFLEGGRHNSA